MTEFATVKIKRFRTKDGKPACRSGKEVCPFGQVHSFGNFWCHYLNSFLLTDPVYGDAIPYDKCPVWEEEK